MLLSTDFRQCVFMTYTHNTQPEAAAQKPNHTLCSLRLEREKIKAIVYTDDKVHQDDNTK